MQITLTPHAERSDDIATVIERLEDAFDTNRDRIVYMQPVQDLTIEDHISRTQYQMTLSNPNLNVLAE